MLCTGGGVGAWTYLSMQVGWGSGYLTGSDVPGTGRWLPPPPFAYINVSFRAE